MHGQRSMLPTVILGAGILLAILLVVSLQLVEWALRNLHLANMSEARFRAIFASAPLGISVIDGHGRFLQTNVLMQQMLGFSESELRDKTFAEVTHSDDVDRDWATYQEVLAGKSASSQMELRVATFRRAIEVDVRLLCCPVRLGRGAIGDRHDDGYFGTQVGRESIRAPISNHASFKRRCVRARHRRAGDSKRVRMARVGLRRNLDVGLQRQLHATTVNVLAATNSVGSRVCRRDSTVLFRPRGGNAGPRMGEQTTDLDSKCAGGRKLHPQKWQGKSACAPHSRSPFNFKTNSMASWIFSAGRFTGPIKAY